MAFPFVLAALFGKAAVGAVSKGLAAKGSAVGAKSATGHLVRTSQRLGFET